MARTPYNIPTPFPIRAEDTELRLRALARVLAEPSLRASVTTEGSGGSRTVRVQVVNAARERCTGLFWFRVIAGSTGDGGGASTTMSVTKGVLMATVTSGQVLDVLTASDGEATLSVSGSGVTRYIRVSQPMLIDGTDAIVFP